VYLTIVYTVVFPGVSEVLASRCGDANRPVNGQIIGVWRPLCWDLKYLFKLNIRFFKLPIRIRRVQRAFLSHGSEPSQPRGEVLCCEAAARRATYETQ
jgi:hypothetical protein